MTKGSCLFIDWHADVTHASCIMSGEIVHGWCCAPTRDRFKRMSASVMILLSCWAIMQVYVRKNKLKAFAIKAAVTVVVPFAMCYIIFVWFFVQLSTIGSTLKMHSHLLSIVIISEENSISWAHCPFSNNFRLDWRELNTSSPIFHLMFHFLLLFKSSNDVSSTLQCFWLLV